MLSNTAVRSPSLRGLTGGETFEGSRTPVTVRTTSKTVTFRNPFSLTGTDEVQPVGIYTVETDEELLQPSSLPAYRRIATLLRLERNMGTVLTQIVDTNPVELAAALPSNAHPDGTVPQRAPNDGVVSLKKARGPVDSVPLGWKGLGTHTGPQLTRQ